MKNFKIGQLANLLIALFAFSTNLKANDASEILEQANQAYIRGEYLYASELYEEIVSMGMESPSLYYNLGNAYFKQNKLSKAILNYERARLLKPFDEHIQYNLELARSRTVDRIEPLPVMFYERWWKKFITSFSVDGWANISLVLLVVLFVSALVYFFSSASLYKRAGFFSGLILFFMILLSLLAAQRQYAILRNNDDAIVFVPRVNVKSAPGENSPDLFVIHEGTKVDVTNRLGEWLEIRLENGHIGWLKEETIMAVRPRPENAAETP